jgi:hypothetical protein
MSFLGDKTKKKMGGWMGNTISIGGRVVKIDACLSSTVVFQMSMRLIHKANIEQIDKPIRSFFWAGSADKKKYHFVRWNWICKPKKKGGLGIKNLYKFNVSLMCKWWWKLESGTGPWQNYMRQEYMRHGGVFYTKKKPGDSPLWTDMLHVKNIYLCGRRMKVGNGRNTSFWCDSWCDQLPLKDRFPEIYDICIEQNVTVAEAAVMHWNFSFRRWMTPDLACQIHGLHQIMAQTVLTEEQDKPVWRWTKGGKFTDKYVYNHLCGAGIDRTFKHLWKSKVPLKIKIWLWMIWHNAIATKDNLLKRNWQGSAICQFCDGIETISHLFSSG